MRPLWVLRAKNLMISAFSMMMDTSTRPIPAMLSSDMDSENRKNPTNAAKTASEAPRTDATPASRYSSDHACRL